MGGQAGRDPEVSGWYPLGVGKKKPGAEQRVSGGGGVGEAPLSAGVCAKVTG